MLIKPICLYGVSSLKKQKNKKNDKIGFGQKFYQELRIL